MLRDAKENQKKWRNFRAITIQILKHFFLHFFQKEKNNLHFLQRNKKRSAWLDIKNTVVKTYNNFENLK